MSFNSFGKIFTITTFGESHGNVVGVIIDGCPSGLEITQEEIQLFVNKRKGNQSKYTTLRAEPDTIEIVSGIYNNITLGTPIAIFVKNVDKNSKDYDNLKNVFRPSHADFSWFNKFNHVDYRGGGRSSARETLSRVIAGAIALKILHKHNISIYSYINSIGTIAINKNNINYNEIDNNIFYSPDNTVISLWEKELDVAMTKGDSLGGTVEIVIKGMPIGIGEPVFEKLNANLAKALFSIPAVKGVEFGDGFNISTKKGSQVADNIISKNNKAVFTSNYNGGILGGISTGEDIIIKVAIKPTSSIQQPQNTIDHNLQPTSISIKGRHDPCIAIRAVSVCKAMVSLVIADALLISKIRNI